MASFELDRMEVVSYEPPVGLHEGIIENFSIGQDWDLGPNLGVRTKSVDGVALCVRSESLYGDSITSWLELSPVTGDSLREFRESMLGRPLTRHEEERFYPQSELKGRRVTYVQKDDGSIAVSLADSLEQLGVDEADHDAALVSPTSGSDRSEGEAT